ncbi:helix-turn-helix domain-containing protein [Siccirubricoccus phaeus]|uniref:helix-turn-helix domain-containing protein n=1 Tax=Siccirubricoccus phaeus TaxID=2595053 RepID=UPI0011F2AE93|nr:helix-turn-helix domain-containing protein [Siccirubricoccus phaeus]
MPKSNYQKVVSAVRVGNGDAGRVVGQSLKALRELVGLTQLEMAHRLNVGQAAISKIEYRGDVQISSLEKYVKALGAKLRIEATFPKDDKLATLVSDLFDLDVSDENQLVLPIFGDEIFRPQRDVVLSIRPQYSKKIIEGTKTVELRRRFPMSAPAGTLAYIYSTSPVRAMVGRAEIIDVCKMSVDDIWKNFAAFASIEKGDFDAYFDNLEEGYALRFANARALPRPLDLNELRERFGFEPPQSFLYAKPVLRKALQDEYADVSH